MTVFLENRMNELLTSAQQFKDLSSPMNLSGLCDAFDNTLFIKGNEVSILRMMLKPKYGGFKFPSNFSTFNERMIEEIYECAVDQELIDPRMWCYLTVIHGVSNFDTLSDWHFDGASSRFASVPERNFIYVDAPPEHCTEYATGRLDIPEDFDMFKHNLHGHASPQVKSKGMKVQKISPMTWYMIDPFCLHRQPTEAQGKFRTFVRLSFTDVEIRDVNNTVNPRFPTNYYGRDGAKINRNTLTNYGEKQS